MNSVLAKSLIISFVSSDKGEDHDIVLVGTKSKGVSVDIVNAFQGKEARELYEKLITKKKPAGDPHVD